MSDFYGGPRWPGKPHPGMFAVDLRTGEKLWFTETIDVCDGREYCDPGLSAASSAIEGGVLGGAMDGRMRAYDRDTGEVLWEFNALQQFDAVGGGTAYGGSFSGAAGPVLDGDMMFMTSGYGIYFHMPGNALLAFKKPSAE
jgi:polyvinyl alcohol dehydrogenase (cytochrome)